jgi:prevent-host-death family protein
VAEAKRRFREVIERVQRGERLVVTRRGKPVLAIVPPGDAAATEPRPKGLLAGLGALAEWDDMDDFVRSAMRARRRAKDRPAPRVD